MRGGDEGQMAKKVPLRWEPREEHAMGEWRLGTFDGGRLHAQQSRSV